MAETEQITKQCTCCGETLPVSAFSPRGDKNGLRCYCKKCSAEKTKEYRKAHPGYWKSWDRDARRRSMSDWYAKNRLRVLAELRQDRIDNPEKYREKDRNDARARRSYSRQYFQEHKEQHVASVREWRHNHPEWVRADKARRRTGESGFTEEDILSKMESQGGLCVWWGRPYGDNYEIDHVVPVSRGGSNAPENIAVACFECNRIKNAKMPPAWPGGNYH